MENGSAHRLSRVNFQGGGGWVGKLLWHVINLFPIFINKLVMGRTSKSLSSMFPEIENDQND